MKCEMSTAYNLFPDFEELTQSPAHYAKPAYTQEDILPIKNNGGQCPPNPKANRNHYYGSTEDTDGTPCSLCHLSILPLEVFLNILQGQLFARHILLLHFLTAELLGLSILPQCSGISNWGSLKGLRPFKTHLSPSPLKERGTQGVR